MRAIAGMIFGLFAVCAARAGDITDPVWNQAPSRGDWVKAYPAHAAATGVAGKVSLRCGATAAGSLQGCAVISESPSGEGFGAAAMSLTAGMSLRRTDEGGQSIAGRELVVPIKFEPSLLGPEPIVQQVNWRRRPTAEELDRATDRLRPRLVEGCSSTAL